MKLDSLGNISFQLNHPAAISYTSVDPKKLCHGFLQPTYMYNEYERPVYKGLDVVFRVGIVHVHPTFGSLGQGGVWLIATMFLYEHTLD